MIIGFIKWIFGIQDKDEEESTEKNNTNDVQKEQHSEVLKLKRDVIQLKKEMISFKKRNEASEQTIRNLNSRLDILAKEDTSEVKTVEEITAELIKISRENAEEVKKDKPKKPKKKKGLRDKLLDNNEK